jgi:hypothetical protein
MANMIERHVVLNKDWPETLLVDNTFQLFTGEQQNAWSRDLVYTQSWQLDSLKVFCATAYLDMIVLTSVERVNDKFVLDGELIKIEMPSEFYAHRLEELFDSNEIQEE